MAKRFFSFLALFLTLALFSFLLVMGSEDSAAPPALSASPLGPAGLLTSQELPLLSAHFELSVPYCSLAGTGRVEDVSYQGNYARLLTWTDENSLTVTCVRPASAAYLLRDDALTPSTQSTYLIDGMTAALFTGSNACALYFGDENAAYCLSIPGSTDKLLQLLPTLQFTD